MTALNNVMSAVQKRVAYSRLKFELQNMPYETAVDLGIFREDAAKIATKAVYG
ncbi:hypothetical protein [Yoonia maritima]|uniref:hypothetical protein n=1 Tax=Yoonia maritima TaxID=1435347 RepID=UPI0037352226